jgi:hypothetical protein
MQHLLLLLRSRHLALHNSRPIMIWQTQCRAAKGMFRCACSPRYACSSIYHAHQNNSGRHKRIQRLFIRRITCSSIYIGGPYVTKLNKINTPAAGPNMENTNIPAPPHANSYGLLRKSLRFMWRFAFGNASFDKLSDEPAGFKTVIMRAILPTATGALKVTF